MGQNFEDSFQAFVESALDPAIFFAGIRVSNFFTLWHDMAWSASAHIHRYPERRAVHGVVLLAVPKSPNFTHNSQVINLLGMSEMLKMFEVNTFQKTVDHHQQSPPVLN